MQEAVAAWLAKSHTCVHLLCDDPSYIEYYHRKYRDRMSESPARVTLGLHWAEPPTDMSTAAGHMQRPRSARLTNLVHFMEDVMLMAKSDLFYATTGSTVRGLVQWYRRALGLPDHFASSIGSWPDHNKASRHAYSAATKILKEVEATPFDPASFRMLHDQGAEIRKLGPLQLRALHEALMSHVSTRRGKPISQTLTEEWYQEHLLLRDNRKAYKQCWEQHRRQGDTRAHMHWFKAVLTHRLNEWLRETRQDFVWGFDGQTVWQLELAYPAGMLDATESSTATVPVAELLADSAAIDLPGGEAPPRPPGILEPPAKRQRVGAVRHTGLTTKAASPIAPSGSAGSGLSEHERRGAVAGATPKPMPRSGKKAAKAAAPAGP